MGDASRFARRSNPTVLPAAIWMWGLWVAVEGFDGGVCGVGFGGVLFDGLPGFDGGWG